jgi:elongation factor 1-beta
MPEGTEVDLERLRAEAEGTIGWGRVQNVQVKPIAFGLKALDIMVIIPDEGGLVERMEEGFRRLPGVQSVETVSVDLV